LLWAQVQDHRAMVAQPLDGSPLGHPRPGLTAELTAEPRGARSPLHVMGSSGRHEEAVQKLSSIPVELRAGRIGRNPSKASLLCPSAHARELFLGADLR